MLKALSLILFIFPIFANSTETNSVKGFNLTENGELLYKANKEGEEKSEAQKIIDQLNGLGVNHIVLNVRAKMIGPTSSEIIPITGSGSVSREARNMKSLIDYIHDLNMTVGIRPIIFVLGPNNEFPYIVNEGTDQQKTWWHGNITPQDPNRWFENFRLYLDRYISIARLTKVDEFTIGAELYSMTVGLEDQWPEYPFGFPGKWLELLDFTRSKLGKNTRIMYDINFTDDVDRSDALAKSGGELERWRYRIVDLADPSDPEEYKIWRNLVDFWNGLDAIGIDMYRSLAFRNDNVSKDYNEALDLLTSRANTYAQQLDVNLFEISITTDSEKPVILKEVGFRSVEQAYIDPFLFSTSQGEYNVEDQALGYEALFKGFWEPEYEWFSGFAFWDAPLNPGLHGEGDTGFSPIGKEQTEDILRKYFIDN